MIEAYADAEAIEDPARLTEMLNFAKRMGKTLDQAAIMLVVGHAVFFIEDFSTTAQLYDTEPHCCSISRFSPVHLPRFLRTYGKVAL